MNFREFINESKKYNKLYKFGNAKNEDVDIYYYVEDDMVHFKTKTSDEFVVGIGDKSKLGIKDPEKAMMAYLMRTSVYK